MPSTLFTLLVLAAGAPVETGIPTYTYQTFLQCEAVRLGMAAGATFGNPQVEFACKQNGLPEATNEAP